MFEVIFDKRAFKELSQLENEAQQLIWSKIAELKEGNFTNDKALKGNHKGKFANVRVIIASFTSKKAPSCSLHYPHCTSQRGLLKRVKLYMSKDKNLSLALL